MVELRELSKQQAQQVEILFPKITTIWSDQNATQEAIHHTKKWGQDGQGVEQSGQIFFIMLTDQKVGITGYLIDSDNNARLRRFGITPEFRRQGYASESLQLLLEQFTKKLKLTWLIKTLPADNKELLSFFKKNGFETFDDPHAKEFLEYARTVSVRKKIER